MTPEDKAKELVEKFMEYADKKARVSSLGNLAMAQVAGIGGLLANQSSVTYNTKYLLQSAKECALIAVNELINMAKIYDNHNVKTDKHIYTFESVIYLEEVKIEIEKL